MIDPSIDKFQTIEELIAFDLEYWLCNMYFEIIKLPRFVEFFLLMILLVMLCSFYEGAITPLFLEAFLFAKENARFTPFCPLFPCVLWYADIT